MRRVWKVRAEKRLKTRQEGRRMYRKYVEIEETRRIADEFAEAVMGDRAAPRSGMLASMWGYWGGEETA